MNPSSPAPWVIGSNGASVKVVDSEGKAVCMLTPRRDQFNGDLIAAAPNLLALLREVYDAIADGTADFSPSGDWFRETRAAIAKATGETA